MPDPSDVPAAPLIAIIDVLGAKLVAVAPQPVAVREGRRLVAIPSGAEMVQYRFAEEAQMPDLSAPWPPGFVPAVLVNDYFAARAREAGLSGAEARAARHATRHAREALMLAARTAMVWGRDEE